MTIVVDLDEELDVITFETPGGLHMLYAYNDGPTWKAVGEDLLRDVKAFGKDAK